ncbi:hypothetical protein QAD02_023545 [Eretmocerus hayati]|uniref:Uncharacterized protein n=1 Tax=Eretmocerus hayati TaxID=131215 RepID=A0ACC2PXV1_9HYME|nr:hypothetical protein QAD02_023545 [Eretmocerus hayati]
MRNVYVIIFCIANNFLRCGQAKILTGQLVTYQNWAFLARFCFLSEKGRFQYDFIIHGKDAEVNLLLYYDTSSQWPSVYPSNKTCEEKESVLRKDLGQIVSLSPYSTFTEVSGCAFVQEEKNVVRCRSYREFRSSRPRWWFIALSDCHSLEGLNVTYTISLTNAETGSFWRQHFSADEFYILPEILIGACIYIILLGFSINIAFELRSRKLLHVTYKMFMVSLLTQLCGLLCEASSLCHRALSGYDLKDVVLIGTLLEACSETIFTTLLLLMSLGYTVTKSVLTEKQSGKLAAFIGLMISLQLLILVYQYHAFDPGLVLYIYESPPGYALLTLKIWAWAVFVTCCYKTSHNAATKYNFYGSLLSLGSGWFLCQPLVVLTITYLVDKWVRESVVKGCSLYVIFVGHLTFLYVTRPSSANNTFPFHIRTFQVVPIGGEGQSHSYEPRTQTATTVFTISQAPPPYSR